MRAVTIASAAFLAEASFVRMPLSRNMKIRSREEGTSRISKHFTTHARQMRMSSQFLSQRNDLGLAVNTNVTGADKEEAPVNVRLFSYHELAYTGPFFVGDGNGFSHIKNMVYDTGSELCWAFNANEGVKCCSRAQCDPVGKRLIGCDVDNKWAAAVHAVTAGNIPNFGNDHSCRSADPIVKFRMGQTTEPFVVCYGRGFARGHFTNSVVRFYEGHKGITHNFGVATTASDLENDFGGCAGLIGLGPKNSRENPSIIYRLWEQKVIDEPVFSFSLKNTAEPEFILGGIDDSLVGENSEMRWFPIKRQRLYSLWWTIDATIHSGDHSHSTPVVLDSGTTAIMMAKSHFDKFVRHVALDFGMRHNDPFLVGNPDGHIDFLDCHHPAIHDKRQNGGHQLRFRLQDVKNGGYHEYVLNPKDYIVELNDRSRQCFFGVAYLGDSDDVSILGDVFLRKYYTAFHFDMEGHPQVGIQTPFPRRGGGSSADAGRPGRRAYSANLPPITFPRNQTYGNKNHMKNHKSRSVKGHRAPNQISDARKPGKGHRSTKETDEI